MRLPLGLPGGSGMRLKRPQLRQKGSMTANIDKLNELIKQRRFAQSRANSLLKFGDIHLAIESQSEVWALGVEIAKAQQEEFASNVLGSISRIRSLANSKPTLKAHKPVAKVVPVKVADNMKEPAPIGVEDRYGKLNS